jgi:hypothetical protein
MQNQLFCVIDTILITENYMSIYPPKFRTKVFTDLGLGGFTLTWTQVFHCLRCSKKKPRSIRMRLIELACPADLIHPGTAIHVN